MFVSTSRLRTLAEVSRPETTASAEDVEVFMLVLWNEASQAGRDAYSARLSEATPGEYPWSAVRPREYDLDSSAWGELEKRITYAPPALSLALARRRDIEPELPGDELPDVTLEGPYEQVFAAWWNWDPVMIIASTTPLGWTIPESEADVRISDSDVDVLGDLFTERPPSETPPIIPTLEGPSSRGNGERPASPSAGAAQHVTWNDAAPWVLGGGVLIAVTAGVYVVATAPPQPALAKGDT